MNRFVQAYRSASKRQQRWLWALAVFSGAYLPLTIDRAGVTRGLGLYVLWSSVVFVAVFVAALAVVTSQERALPQVARRSAWFDSLKYAALPFAVFCVYLAAYYPAMMNADSYDQWHQIVEYRFDAFFPVGHTIVYWLPTLLWRSPAAPILLQMALLALAFGFSMAVAERAGAPSWLLWTLTVLFAVHPVNGFFSVTFLKDILFSAAVLWLTVVVFSIYWSGGNALASRGSLIHLTLALAFAALLRPNGPVPAFGTLGLLFVCYRPRWRQLLAVACAVLLLYLGTNVGLARATHLSYVNSGFYSASPFIYDIGAVLHSDLVPNPNAKPGKKRGKPVDTRMVNRNGKVKPEEWAVLAQFDDVHEWGKLYRPDLIPYWHTKKDNWELLDEPAKKAELVRTWFALAKRYPWVILHHKILASRVGWQIDADDLNVNMETFGPVEKEFKLKVPKFAPGLTEVADQLLKTIQKKRSVRWFLSHPGIYTYGCLFLLGAYAIRRASALSLLVGAPLVLNWIATMAFCMAQNTRYFYASFLILPFIAALPWTAPVSKLKRDLGPEGEAPPVEVLAASN